MAKTRTRTRQNSYLRQSLALLDAAFNDSSLRKSDIVVIPVDVQETYCNTNYLGTGEMESVAFQHIEALRALRKEGIDVMWVAASGDPAAARHAYQQGTMEAFYNAAHENASERFSFVSPLAHEPIFFKSHDSAFADPDCGLHATLQEREKKILIFTGVITEDCVRRSMLGARENKYPHVMLATDLTAGYLSNAEYDAGFATLSSPPHNIACAPSLEIIRHLQGLKP